MRTLFPSSTLQKLQHWGLTAAEPPCRPRSILTPAGQKYINHHWGVRITNKQKNKRQEKVRNRPVCPEGGALCSLRPGWPCKNKTHYHHHHRFKINANEWVGGAYLWQWYLHSCHKTPFYAHSSTQLVIKGGGDTQQLRHHCHHSCNILDTEWCH